MESRYLRAFSVLALFILHSGCTQPDTEPEPVTTTHSTSTTTPTTSSTSTSSSTLLSTSTTLAPTTSTLPFRFECSVNRDCGEITEALICYMGDVYVNRIIPTCQSPNTPYAKCVNTTKLSMSPVEKCGGNRCQAGRCINQ
ncbi:MAG: hypothetical protein GF416_08315 [Candidatus Altiarchaeales archaeon]|nr:hypothetical protein [Candidatus Altiarchaeales archaeon]MBD3417119.1 hypothetical protein [Candidatus Altiarchaeales archaeon]